MFHRMYSRFQAVLLPNEAMAVTRELFASLTDPVSGNTEPVYKYKLLAEGGVEVHLLSYGAGICGVMAPDKNGVKDNVVLGFDSLDGYQAYSYQGSSIGRIANRIKAGIFPLSEHTFGSDGRSTQVQRQVTLACNRDTNHLHGGERGWAKRVWSGTPTGEGVVFTLISEDGEEGYPGTMMAQVEYRLSSEGALSVQYTVLTSAPCPINMTNHAYFNLAGHTAGRTELVRHTAQLHCDRYLPVAADLIPLGEQRPVENSPFDFRTEITVGEALAKVEGGGFDHCFVLKDDRRGTLRQAAKIAHPPSGRVLEVWTTEPGVQFYTANYLPEAEGVMVGRGGASYTRQGSFCCEPQNLPNAVNQKNFPNCILKPGEVYKHKFVYKFALL